MFFVVQVILALTLQATLKLILEDRVDPRSRIKYLR